MDHKTETFLEYKTLLFSIAYNMLGSVDAAEDLVQDTYLKWMEMRPENVQHHKAYLVKIITNKSINYLHSARVKREEYIGIWLPEPLQQSDTQSFRRVEMYHALSIGIMVLLEKLTPHERAIFLLKEVFAYDYHELAEIFDKTADNCRQLFKRAKDHLGQGTRRFEVDIQAHEKILQRFMEAVSEGQMEQLVDLLKEDIVLFADGGGTFIPVNRQRLTAALRPIYGREHVCRLLISAVPKLYQAIPEARREIAIANGLPSIISYVRTEAVSLVSIELEGGQIKNIYVQTNPEKLKHF
ncbi:sigma-70 family RNA polymerase sigma factor [Chitinophaga agrisoli]|uniref:Sigma-70 family RNA polymerase sigma factor n=1 Tax=Chitinophaga agrisoli TaxID=2607653 RepID=A0A5B2VQ58_9BACT|nr:RNA polymerase sigma factor SigJ [Chitinophaga agrisoli]KAA2240357.1 sigma-70 family RNA polymerase sigma factor [Chitinophaga agrisoli]